MNSKCEIISVGTELLLGQIVDTNASWLSEKLNNIGLNVYYHQTVGDNFNRLASVFEQAQKRSNIIIVTGGLGPTEDDLTREVAASLFETDLKLDEPTFQEVQSYYTKRNLTMTENNRKQALYFNGGEVFHNKVGMAPGLHFEHKGVLWFFLPGVPKEMKWIANEKVIPFLHDKGLTEGKLFHRILTFQGIGESALETELLDLIQGQTNPTIAPLAGNGYIMIRLTAKANQEARAVELLDDTEQLVHKRVGDYFFDYGDQSLDQQLIHLLTKHEMTLSACESITGGQFASTIIANEGVSQLFKGSIISYTDEMKEEIVGIPHHLLQNEGAVSEACAKSMADNTQRMSGSNLSISFTGVAGPNEVNGYEPGTVFIAINYNGETKCEHYHFSGDRNQIRDEAVQAGLKQLILMLTS
ncbi:competence/damage-inducible protein A [Alkalibacillus haloalkaliphilus]|uniref:competence/damage-inducible protein A n=1 Tax=Alkalibacillus haloalkaliphilus TaxID=94136 RepID=UPI0029362EBA|nr:competence/damage-inducible protein A [Alkalibacillus haloalkaliphilus]MDV2580668.1 competence/damage-inducible protein A [Alkalibacillus haloalkaliphilus]